VTERIYVEGELYLSLEEVARVYEVKTVWLQEVCDSGLLSGRGASGGELCIAAVELDRVATIVRLHRVLGLDLEVIAATLDRA